MTVQKRMADRRNKKRNAPIVSAHFFSLFITLFLLLLYKTVNRGEVLLRQTVLHRLTVQGMGRIQERGRQVLLISRFQRQMEILLHPPQRELRLELLGFQLFLLRRKERRCRSPAQQRLQQRVLLNAERFASAMPSENAAIACASSVFTTILRETPLPCPPTWLTALPMTSR